MFCKNCGNQLKDNAKFCTKCGAAVSRIAPPPRPEIYRAAAKSNGSRSFLDGPANPALAQTITHFVLAGLLLMLIGFWFLPLVKYQKLWNGWFTVTKGLYNVVLAPVSTIVTILLNLAAAGLLVAGFVSKNRSLQKTGRILSLIAVARYALYLILFAALANPKLRFGFYLDLLIVLFAAMALYYLYRGPAFRNVLPTFDLQQVTKNWKRTVFYGALGILLLVLALLQGANVYNLVVSVVDNTRRTGLSLRTYYVADEISNAYSFCLWLSIITLLFCVFRIFTRIGGNRRRNLVLPIVAVAVELFFFFLGWIRYGSQVSGGNENISVGVHWSVLGWLYVLLCAGCIFLLVQLRKTEGQNVVSAAPQSPDRQDWPSFPKI